MSQIVPVGYFLKAFPIHTIGLNAENIFEKIMQNKLGKEIVETKGDLIRFGVRAKAIVYPESAIGVWIIIAVKYKPIP